MLQGRDIVCFSTADWDTALPTNKHQIMTHLARRNRVLFVETLGTRTVRWSSGTDLSRIRRRLRRALDGPRAVHPVFWPVGRFSSESDGNADTPLPPQGAGLWVLSPLVVPRWSNPWMATLNRMVLQFQLRKAVRTLGFKNPMAWIYSPHAVWILKSLCPDLVLYHCVDDLSAIPGAESEALRRAEATLLRRADHVICTEAALHRHAMQYHPHPHLMENVADFDHFHTPRLQGLHTDTLRQLRAIQDLPHPRLLFSGHLAPHKVDFDLLLAIKRRHPEWSLILVGPEWEGASLPKAFQELKREPAVHRTGRIEYADLPAILHTADVLLIPYAINDVTRHVSPLKFFEYLATGKPIVATPLPSIVRYADLAGLSDTPEGFITEIEKALSDPDSRQSLRLALARRQTWGQRLQEISRILGT